MHRSRGIRGDAVLFHDTFTDYYHPEVGQAAVRVLEALGYNVIMAERTGCCGRPAISKGLLPTAKRWAAQNVDALLPLRRARRADHRHGAVLPADVPATSTRTCCDDPSDRRRSAAQTFLLDELS